MIVEKLARWIDERLGTAHFVRHALQKAFPDHWSFMLGEINLYAFVILVATGTFLALFFDPNTTKTIYHGPYAVLDGAKMSHAYATTLDLSFVVNGGLLVRQIHHWAALIFLAGIIVHMARIFLTGAFRKPREINWVIGVTLLGIAMFEGFCGYSLPDDLLSGTGLRIAVSIALSIPVIGTWASFLLLGGDFPSEQMIPRLFVTHIFILPAVIAALIGIHLAIVWRQKHSQFPGPRRSEDNVVGSPMFPTYAVKSMALFAMIAFVVCALGATTQINPIWLWGPYDPWKAPAPAQPDWYIGWLEGALRIAPPWAWHPFGHTIPSPFWPAVLLPGLVFAFLLLWPWIEQIITRDTRSHQLLDRPREVPWRTALGAALLTFALSLTAAGSDDVQARYLHVSIVDLVHFYQAFTIGGPLLAFIIAYAVACELRGRGGVRKAPRVRLRRNARGGFEEESVP
ncbi:MAG TPA: cytochrome bc complex cytochrome b subunit [Candidatus Baltobacteraceae bacterium]|jgi:ubiquinol-cytochrome c reductase cytochrome b subunit|nr:cytochrome bc complex cytochrome b subunit [Candidatus Baltobacteraceae bacterium]